MRLSLLRNDVNISSLKSEGILCQLRLIEHSMMEETEIAAGESEMFDDLRALFSNMAVIFSKFRQELVDKKLRDEGLIALLTIITETLSKSDEHQDKVLGIGKQIEDVVYCLSFSNAVVQDAATKALEKFGSKSYLASEMRNEFDRVISNANAKDRDYITKIKIVAPSVLPSTMPIAQPSLSPTMTKKEFTMTSNSGNSSEELCGSDDEINRMGLVMKLSFLPHSITEQWLLAQDADELSFVLEEITAIYVGLSNEARQRARQDMPFMLRQVLVNMATEQPVVIKNSIKFMEVVADNCVEVYLEGRSILDSLYPKIYRYLEHESKEVRQTTLKLAVSLVAQLPFELTDTFIVSVIGRTIKGESSFEIYVKLACVSLLAASTEFSSTNTTYEESKNLISKRMFAIKVMRISHGALKLLAGKMLLGAEKSQTSDSQLILDAIQIAAPKSESIKYLEICKDILAVTLIALFCDEADPTSGIFPEALPEKFLEMLFPHTDAMEKLSPSLQLDITLRASGLSFPSMVTDNDISQHVRGILSTRASVNSKIPLKMKEESAQQRQQQSLRKEVRGLSQNESDKDALVTQEKGFSSSLTELNLNDDRSSKISKRSNQDTDRASAGGYDTWPLSPQKREETQFKHSPVSNKLATDEIHSHRGLTYVPSWGENISAISEHSVNDSINGGDSSSPGGSIDRTKLHALKTSRRKPGSRRAHSAEVGSSREMEGSHLSPAPSTSHDFRHPRTNTLSSTEMQSSLTPTSIGNYVNDGKAGTKRVQQLRIPKRLKNHRNSGEDLIMDTTEYTIDGDDKSFSRMREEESGNFEHFNPSAYASLDSNVTSTNPQLMSPVKTGGCEGRSRGSDLISPRGIKKRENTFTPRARMREAEQEWKSSSMREEQEASTASSLSPAKKPSNRRAQRRPPKAKDAESFVLEKGSEVGTEHDRKTPSALKPDSLEYLDTADIEPSTAPKKDLGNVLNVLHTQEWPEIFHTLNTVRQLALHHKNLVLNGGKTTVHALTQGVMKQVENLRSQVAKNAILALGDMFIGLGKSMDGESMATIGLLIKKCGDQATSFLAGSSEMSLCYIIDNVTSTRSLTGLLAASESRNPTLRGKVAAFLHFLVVQKADELRGKTELDMLTHRLKFLIKDNTPEARASSRDIIKILVEKDVCDRTELDRILTQETVAKALSMPPGSTSPMRSPKRVSLKCHGKSSPITMVHEGLLDSDDDDVYSRPLASPSKFTLKTKRVAEREGLSMFATTADNVKDTLNSYTPSPAKLRAAKRALDANEELQVLDAIKARCGDSLWTERKDGLSSMTDIIIKHHGILKDAGRLERCLQLIMDKLQDGSVKIILHTLACVGKIHQEAPTIFSGIQRTLIYGLMNTASSTNKQVSHNAISALKEIIFGFDVEKIMHQLCHIAHFEKERLKITSFKVLTTLVARKCVNIQNPASVDVIRGDVFSAIVKTVGGIGAKGELRVAAAECLREIQHHCPMGEQVWAWASDPKVIEELKRCCGKG